MKILITPGEIVRLAFGDTPGVGKDMIPEVDILSAQEKYLRPVFGKLYESLLKGHYPDLTEAYIKPALALYVKASIVRSRAISIGRVGLIQPKNSNWTPAPETNVRQLVRAIRSDARTLMSAAIEHIEKNKGDYPEYEPRGNIMKRVNILSNIIL